ncbi:MAG TPA: DUF4421 family protein [Bacteroidia bacterium]|nr:DUF4421 family protein [Bacteroidia bacterium]
MASFSSFSQTDSLKQEKHGNAFIRFHRKLIKLAIQEPKPFYDTNYVKRYSKIFTLGVPIVSKSLRINLQEKVSGNTLQYYPTPTYSTGLFVNTSLFGFYVMPGFMSIHQGSKRRGTSDFNDYQLNIYSKRFFFDISFQIYKGFYLNNTYSYDPYQNQANYYQRSDLSAISGGFNIYYVFNNKRFSYRAPFSFTQSQIKSAGSFIIGTYLSDFSFTADSSVIDDRIQYMFPNFPLLKSGNSFSTGLSFGYAYTFVLKKRWYITTTLVPGLGFNVNSLEKENLSVVSGNNTSVKLKYTFGLGYTSHKWFYGCMFTSDSYSSLSATSPYEINYRLNRLRFFVGRRLNAKKLEKIIVRKFGIEE